MLVGLLAMCEVTLSRDRNHIGGVIQFALQICVLPMD